jgi:hypothetical protein
VRHGQSTLTRRHAGGQVLAFSATYTEALLAQLRQLMTCPQEVMLCRQTVTLQGAACARHGVRSAHRDAAAVHHAAPFATRRGVAIFLAGAA